MYILFSIAIGIQLQLDPKTLTLVKTRQAQKWKIPHKHLEK